MSPSMRREWIEIASTPDFFNISVSPSMRREWIEMPRYLYIPCWKVSPSMRREWIEIKANYTAAKEAGVSLHAEGVD